jgi:alanine-glyoxylate transaminase/serine-glyoxylate transaminase/serine-pyruvate transaminase
VTVVHAETSTGVLNPVEEIAGVARERGAAIVVDAVTSLGAHPVEVARWGLDACYSCTQKGLGAPSGLAPLTVTGSGLARRVEARSFYLDLRLIEDFWVRRKYHHTISAPLVYALREALLEIEDEGLAARWARHRRHHHVLVSGLAAMDLHLLPPASERLWTIAAVKVPAGVDEAALRRHLLAEHNIEIGAGLGPLAGRIWRLGLMGTGSSVQSILLLVSALEHALRAQGHRVPAGAGTAAVVDALDRAASVA